MRNKLEIIKSIQKLLDKIKDEELNNLSNEVVSLHILDEELLRLEEILQIHHKKILQLWKITK